ncbi:hypothetical protein Syun_016709 [Stephania yunnanensis]|uniref:C2 domain-containing protein n=1 Tax=Stephania yunnanensis TaxID=152371 RepID=A0AAP0P1R2_9MAGN
MSSSSSSSRPPSKLYDLDVTVISAKHLKNVNWRQGELKPFARLWLDPLYRYTTKPDESGSTRPVWNERFTIPITTLPLHDSLLNLEICHFDSPTAPSSEPYSSHSKTSKTTTTSPPSSHPPPPPPLRPSPGQDPPQARPPRPPRSAPALLRIPPSAAAPKLLLLQRSAASAADYSRVSRLRGAGALLQRAHSGSGALQWVFGSVHGVLLGVLFAFYAAAASAEAVL